MSWNETLQPQTWILLKFGGFNAGNLLPPTPEVKGLAVKPWSHSTLFPKLGAAWAPGLRFRPLQLKVFKWERPSLGVNKSKSGPFKRERWLDQNAALSYLFHKNLPPLGQSGLMSMVNANHSLVSVSAAQSLNFTAFKQQWKITRNFLLGSGISLATAGQAYCNSIYALNSFRSLFFKICHSQRALGNYYKCLNLWPAGESKR